MYVARVAQRTDIVRRTYGSGELLLVDGVKGESALVASSLKELYSAGRWKIGTYVQCRRARLRETQGERTEGVP